MRVANIIFCPKSEELIVDGESYKVSYSVIRQFALCETSEEFCAKVTAFARQALLNDSFDKYFKKER